MTAENKNNNSNSTSLDEQDAAVVAHTTKLLQMTTSNMIVKLNIGGQKFITTAATLFKQSEENFFTGLLSGKFKCPMIDDDYFFIDRDGYLFRFILKFLRTGYCTFSAETVDPVALKQEFDFYQIAVGKDLDSVTANNAFDYVLDETHLLVLEKKVWNERWFIVKGGYNEDWEKYDLITRKTKAHVRIYCGIQIKTAEEFAQHLVNEMDFEIVQAFEYGSGNRSWQSRKIGYYMAKKGSHKNGCTIVIAKPEIRQTSLEKYLNDGVYRC